MRSGDSSYECSGTPEKRVNGKLLAYSLGGAALGLAGYWAAKNLATHTMPATHRLLDRLNLIEREGHPQTVAIFQTIAESFGINVQEEQVTYWRSMLTVARALDTIVDKTRPESLDTEALTLLSGEPIPGISKAEAEEFQRVVSNVSDERRAIILSGLQISDFAKKMRSASKIEELLKLRKEEGALFARIMTINNPRQEPAIDAFNDWFIEFGSTGYQLDSLVDLIDDFKNGTTAIHPTPANYLAIGKKAARDSYTLLFQLPKRTVAYLAIAGIHKAARKTLSIQAHR